MKILTIKAFSAGVSSGSGGDGEGGRRLLASKMVVVDDPGAITLRELVSTKLGEAGLPLSPALPSESSPSSSSPSRTRPRRTSSSGSGPGELRIVRVVADDGVDVCDLLDRPASLLFGSIKGGELEVTLDGQDESQDCQDERERGTDECPDVLGRLVARAHREKRANTNPQDGAARFDPSNPAPLLPVSVCGDADVMDSVSAITPASHLPGEPNQSNVDFDRRSSSAPPDVATLRQMVGAYVSGGNDAGAIDMVITSLLQRNMDGAKSPDVPLFCLTALCVLARNSDENKGKIILGNFNFEAIVETMEIYLATSVEIQTAACGLLWTLTMGPIARVRVAESGGCRAVLNAMKLYAEDGKLQEMTFGLLKALSLNDSGKRALRAAGASSVIADVMRRYVRRNPAIHREGLAILGNLSEGDEGPYPRQGSEEEIDAVMRGMAASNASPGAREAARSTMARLTSSAANAVHVHNDDATETLQGLSLVKSSDEVIQESNNVDRVSQKSPASHDREMKPPLTPDSTPRRPSPVWDSEVNENIKGSHRCKDMNHPLKSPSQKLKSKQQRKERHKRGQSLQNHPLGKPSYWEKSGSSPIGVSSSFDDSLTNNIGPTGMDKREISRIASATLRHSTDANATPASPSPDHARHRRIQSSGPHISPGAQRHSHLRSSGSQASPGARYHRRQNSNGSQTSPGARSNFSAVDEILEHYRQKRRAKEEERRAREEAKLGSIATEKSPGAIVAGARRHRRHHSLSSGVHQRHVSSGSKGHRRQFSSGSGGHRRHPSSESLSRVIDNLENTDSRPAACRSPPGSSGEDGKLMDQFFLKQLGSEFEI